MTWNHRIIRHVNRQGFEFYAIHEVYYNAEGGVSSFTEESIAPYGETPAELRAELERMLGACSKPALDHNMFEAVQTSSELVKEVRAIINHGVVCILPSCGNSKKPGDDYCDFHLEEEQAEINEIRKQNK